MAAKIIQSNKQILHCLGSLLSKQKQTEKQCEKVRKCPIKGELWRYVRGIRNQLKKLPLEHVPH